MSDEKDAVRVGRFEWERLMLMSVPHPQNFKLLPLGVFMSADGGKARPGNASLAMFGPHEKTWAKLLRWAVAEGWLLLVARGGARRGPEGRTIVRASVYAASVPQSVWERRMEILGAPPFRAVSVEGSAPESLKGAPDGSPEGLKGAPDGSLADPDSLKGAPETPFNAPDPSLKGAPGDSLPDSLKGAIGSFEGSDPSFEGSVSGFEGSAQTLPHHVVTPSSSSSSTSSTTVVAEVSPEVLEGELIEEGGGGGPLSLKDITEQCKRVDAFVGSLDYRGRAPGKKQRTTIGQRVTVAFMAGWNEQTLADYLDISDDPNVRSPAAVYLHRLSEDELPDPPAVAPSLMPACAACLEGHPAAEFNLRFRERDGQPCPACHPAVFSGHRPYQPPADQSVYNNGFNGRPLTGTDARVAGWMDLSEKLAAEENGVLSTADKRVAQGLALAAKYRQEEQRAAGTSHNAGVLARSRARRQQGGHQPYSNNSWSQPADPAEAAKLPHCGDIDCDEQTRLRDGRDDQDIPYITPCSKCHPSMQFR